jgi:hypothetical protein
MYLTLCKMMAAAGMLCLCVWCLFRRLQEDQDRVCVAVDMYRRLPAEERLGLLFGCCCAQCSQIAVFKFVQECNMAVLQLIF